MTIVVLWYREKFDELWCAADSRISNTGATATDSGAKIFPVPINCHRQTEQGVWKEYASHKIGFAFAGSSLSALNTLALASACTQALSSAHGAEELPSVEAVADLFRNVAEFYMRDISSRMVGTSTKLTHYFFDSFIFGFCPKERSYKAFALIPALPPDGSFCIHKAHVSVKPLTYTPMGSGADRFVDLSEELAKTFSEPGVVPTLNEMLKRESQPDVGGYFQLGIAGRSGFDLVPIIEGTRGERRLHFLGRDVNALGAIDGFTVGFKACAPDLP